MNHSPERYLPVMDFGAAMMSAGVPGRYDAPAMNASARADINYMVGGQDRVFVMLHDDHGVAEIAQMSEGFKQAFIVALVQADGGFVENVQYAGQAGADLRGEADTLAFAARQRAGIARQGEVVEADIIQKFQPFADFLQDATGDFVLLVRQPCPAARRTSRSRDGWTVPRPG